MNFALFCTDEAQAYIAFCALMSRLGENFSFDGKAISRKFQNLTTLLKHYDSEFYLYLYEHGAHELLFCYRWILLDLKREFPFEDSLEMLEVLWASIPPNSSAYQNLFDDGYLYIPYRNKSKVFKSSEGNKPRSEKIDNSKSPSKLLNQRIKSIKFLPNVLSSDSQVIDSPTMSDNDECENLTKSNSNQNRSCFTEPFPWNSPDLSKQRKMYNFEQQTLGSVSNDCYEATLLNEQIFDGIEKDEELTFSNYRKTNCNCTKSHVDDLSSCSTYDSYPYIHRSNTLSSVIQGKCKCKCLIFLCIFFLLI